MEGKRFPSSKISQAALFPFQFELPISWFFYSSFVFHVILSEFVVKSGRFSVIKTLWMCECVSEDR